jgi:hypothetical protein
MPALEGSCQFLKLERRLFLQHNHPKNIHGGKKRQRIHAVVRAGGHGEQSQARRQQKNGGFIGPGSP